MKTTAGDAGFTALRYKTHLLYPHGSADISASRVHVLSGVKNAVLDSSVQTVCVHSRLPYTAFRLSLYDWTVHSARLKINGNPIAERSRQNRFYRAGFSVFVPQLRSFLHSDYYWGNAAFGLHDFGSFIAKPELTALFGTIQKLHISPWYTCSFGMLKAQGLLKNKYSAQIARGHAQFFLINQNIHIPLSEPSRLTLFASYIHMATGLRVRLTAENQGYHLFPYRFYRADTVLSGGIFGFGSSYAYYGRRFTLNTAAALYSVVWSSGTADMHSKKKKSWLFDGEEKQSTANMPSFVNNHLLLCTFSASYRLSSLISLVTEKIIPIPLFAQEGRLTALAAQKTASIDPLLSGLTLKLVIKQ